MKKMIVAVCFTFALVAIIGRQMVGPAAAMTDTQVKMAQSASASPEWSFDAI